jgi:hypothetical protein
MRAARNTSLFARTLIANSPGRMISNELRARESNPGCLFRDQSHYYPNELHRLTLQMNSSDGEDEVEKTYSSTTAVNFIGGNKN